MFYSAKVFVIGVPSRGRVVEEGNHPPSLRRCFPHNECAFLCPLKFFFPDLTSVWAMTQSSYRAVSISVLRAPFCQGKSLKVESSVVPLLQLGRLASEFY